MRVGRVSRSACSFPLIAEPETRRLSTWRSSFVRAKGNTVKSWRHFDEYGIEDVSVVRLREASLGPADAGELYEDMILVASRERALPDLVVNLQQVKFLSSTTLGAILAVVPKLRGRGGRVILAEAPPIVMELLEIQNLGDLLHVFPTEDAAIAWSRDWRLDDTLADVD